MMAGYGSNIKLPTYLIQAHTATMCTWVTESHADTLDDAREKAYALYRAFQRRVRIVDQEERVHLRLSARTIGLQRPA